MKNKGFTLTEMLVVIGIITLITIMVFPAISKMWSSNEKKKFESYEKMAAEYAEATRQRGTTSICDLGKSTDLEEVKRDCVGYVIESAGSYKAYLKCEKIGFTSEDYNSSISSQECN